MFSAICANHTSISNVWLQVSASTAGGKKICQREFSPTMSGGKEMGSTNKMGMRVGECSYFFVNFLADVSQSTRKKVE